LPNTLLNSDITYIFPPTFSWENPGLTLPNTFADKVMLQIWC
jgi:hypothetical protein